MNQHELVAKIADQTGLTKKNVGEVLTELALVATQQLRDGHDVVLPGLGKLSITHREARTGRNPKTGASIAIPAKNAPAFSAGKALKDAVA